MMKQPFSIAPWSLILSLYFIPAQDSFAQESDEIESTENQEVTETTEQSVESEDSNGNDGSEDTDSSHPLPQKRQRVSPRIANRMQNRMVRLMSLSPRQVISSPDSSRYRRFQAVLQTVSRSDQ